MWRIDFLFRYNYDISIFFFLSQWKVKWNESIIWLVLNYNKKFLIVDVCYWKITSTGFINARLFSIQDVYLFNFIVKGMKQVLWNHDFLLSLIKTCWKGFETFIHMPLFLYSMTLHQKNKSHASISGRVSHIAYPIKLYLIEVQPKSTGPISR